MKDRALGKHTEEHADPVLMGSCEGVGDPAPRSREDCFKPREVGAFEDRGIDAAKMIITDLHNGIDSAK